MSKLSTPAIGFNLAGDVTQTSLEVVLRRKVWWTVRTGLPKMVCSHAWQGQFSGSFLPISWYFTGGQQSERSASTRK